MNVTFTFGHDGEQPAYEDRVHSCRHVQILHVGTSRERNAEQQRNDFKMFCTGGSLAPSVLTSPRFYSLSKEVM